MAQPDNPESLSIELQGDMSMLGGIWANFAVVSHSPHEFTLDFARLDYGIHPLQGVIVQRVNMSPLFVSQLIDALTENLAKYAASMPDALVSKEDTDDER